MYTLSESPIDLIACQKMTFSKNGIPLYAYYYPSDLSKPVEITFDATISVLNKFDEPVLIDPISGDIYEVCEPEFRRGFGYNYNLPIKEYPLILTDKKVFEIK